MSAEKAKSTKEKTGILLLNLGTPRKATPWAVGLYLREFLMDRRVVDLPWVFRWVLVYVLILPIRAFRSCSYYKRVWTPAGSPLFVNSLGFAKKLQEKMGAQNLVALAMRYGRPSIAEARALFEKNNIRKIKVIPLYPQDAPSSTGTGLSAVYQEFSKNWDLPFLQVLEPFFNRPEYLESIAALGRPLLQQNPGHHALFCFHGVPERHIRKSATAQNECLSERCCEEFSAKNQNCYRAQCFETARQLANRLGLKKEQYSVGFQSRLGRTPWIKPYLEDVLRDLLAKNKKDLIVFSPSFVADCLETIEELDIRIRKDFQSRGGRSFVLVPCLNDSDLWVGSAVEMIENL